MYAAVIEPLPALLGPFAILLLSIAILSAHFAAVLGTALPKNRRSALHSFLLLRKMEFRRASRTPAHSRFCPRRRPRTLNALGCDGFILFHSATRLRSE